MKIEFAVVGDGTNVEVRLSEELSGCEVTKDRFYTQQHQLQICARPGKPEYMLCEKFFIYLEEVLPLPVIGGRYAHLHPYWQEREARKKKRG
jgi:hypothetical protein